MDSQMEVTFYRPKPSDLVAFLPYACCQLEAPFHLRVKLETLEEFGVKYAADDKGKKSKRDKTTPPPPPQASAGQEVSADIEPASVEPDYVDASDVQLRVRCDAYGCPVELLFHRCSQIPRLLMKIIGLCIPFHEQLTRIAVRWGPLDGAVLYEIAKFLPLSQITEILLDDSPVPHGNYHLLLERPSALRSLSLARCSIADEECAALAARLAAPQPVARGLACLSLEGNRIGDAGAHALAEALRTNRSLRHLNLAGNSITSLGAAHLFSSLMRFPVTGEELILKRARTFEYLKLRRDAVARCYRELTESPTPTSEMLRSRSRSVNARGPRYVMSDAQLLALRAEAMADRMVSALVEPFDPPELDTQGDVTYCAGNFSLSYLNLAYNELDCTTAACLADMLAYQREAAGAGGGQRGPGLLRVVLEGNALPAECGAAAQELLERAVADAAPTPRSQIKSSSRKINRLK